MLCELDQLASSFCLSPLLKWLSVCSLSNLKRVELDKTNHAHTLQCLQLFMAFCQCWSDTSQTHQIIFRGFFCLLVFLQECRIGRIVSKLCFRGFSMYSFCFTFHAIQNSFELNLLVLVSRLLISWES